MNQSKKKRIQCPFCLKYVRVAPGECCSENECPSHKQDIEIPKEAFDHVLFPIFVIGGMSTGKTAFLCAIIYSKQKNYLGDYAICKHIHYKYKTNSKDENKGGSADKARVANKVTDNNDDNNADPYLDILNHRFGIRGQVLDSTSSEGEHLPLLISVTLKKWDMAKLDFPWNIHRIRKSKILLCFTDPAGEDFRLRDAEKLLDKYPVFREHAKAIITLMDPSEILNWQEKLLKYRKEEKTNRATAAGSILNMHQIPNTRIPIAICITKLDELDDVESDNDDKTDKSKKLKLLEEIKKHLPELNKDLLQIDDDHETHGNIRGKLSTKQLEDLEDIDKAIRDTLWEHGYREIFVNLGINTQELGATNQGEELSKRKAVQFPYHVFLVMSSLGKDKMSDSENNGKWVFNGNNPEPYRVWDPILWILWQYGYLGNTGK